MRLLSAKNGKSDRKNTNRTPTPSTGNIQGQPLHPMPEYFDKYYWTNGRGSHKGGNCKSKSPGNKYNSTMESRIDRSNYGCT